MERKRNLIIAVTGASGSRYARQLCHHLLSHEELGEIALIVTDTGMQVAACEDSTQWMESTRWSRYDNHDLFAPPASGSASYDAMVILPCSMGTLGRIANGISADLLGRAADVMLKERRKLILVPREAPLSTIHLRNMLHLSEAGAVICPACPSFYSAPSSLETVCDTVVERVLSLLGVEEPHYEWSGRSR
ncbi:MAG: UbiX family flavin prenyltransferase [Alistipes sp.]|nr:UbiX family flavin prenyltransferase [Alistipes sp.]